MHFLLRRFYDQTYRAFHGTGRGGDADLGLPHALKLLPNGLTTLFSLSPCARRVAAAFRSRRRSNPSSDLG